MKMVLPPIKPPFGPVEEWITDHLAKAEILRRNLQARQNKIDRLNLETERIRIEKNRMRKLYGEKPKVTLNIFNPPNIWSGKRR
jgi:hypothetical protein